MMPAPPVHLSAFSKCAAQDTPLLQSAFMLRVRGARNPEPNSSGIPPHSGEIPPYENRNQLRVKPRSSFSAKHCRTFGLTSGHDLTLQGLKPPNRRGHPRNSELLENRSENLVQRHRPLSGRASVPWARRTSGAGDGGRPAGP